MKSGERKTERTTDRQYRNIAVARTPLSPTWSSQNARAGWLIASSFRSAYALTILVAAVTSDAIATPMITENRSRALDSANPKMKLADAKIQVRGPASLKRM